MSVQITFIDANTDEDETKHVVLVDGALHYLIEAANEEGQLGNWSVLDADKLPVEQRRAEAIIRAYQALGRP